MKRCEKLLFVSYSMYTCTCKSFLCFAVDSSLNGSRFDYVHAPVTAVKPLTLYDVTRADGIRVRVMQADITTIRADVIVNAANEALHHIGWFIRFVNTCNLQQNFVDLL